MSSEAFGRTIQLFLVDGTPNGLRKATIHGWTGLTFVATASTFAALTARGELDRTGIYILAGPDADAVGGIRAYIGSANSVRERIKQSAQQRDFWESAIAVTTSDDDLSKGHVEYLEARLIELAHAANRVTLDNGTAPAGNRRRLPEADQANMEQFLANLKIILPVVGLELLKPQPRAVAQASDPVGQRTTGEVTFEIRHKSGLAAFAVEEDGEFIVLEGSEAMPDTGGMPGGYSSLKKSLIEHGNLRPNGSGRFIFCQPTAFSSPSAAATVVYGRSSNGRKEWKVKDTSQSYHDWQQARVANDEVSA